MNAVQNPVPSTALAAADGSPEDGSRFETSIPTTDAQREVWLAAMLGAEASMAFNESLLLRLRGPLERPALARAVDALVARHQSLRASFSADGSAMRVRQPESGVLALSDLRTLDAPERDRARNALHEAAVATPFALQQGPLFEARLLVLDADDHELLLRAHHAVCDGWSWGLIVEQLGQLYALETGHSSTPLPPAPAFADFAAAEAAQAAQPHMQAHVQHWLARFPGSSAPVLELPCDLPRPAVRQFDSRRIELRLDAELVSTARASCARAGCGLFAGLLSAFAATLHRLTGQDDLVVGIPAAGQLAHDMPELVGHCVNLLPLRIDVSPTQSFGALMQGCAKAVLDAFDHQALTYGALLERLALPREPSRLPLVSVMFNLDPDVAAGTDGFGPELAVTQDSIARRYENFDLFLNLRPQQGALVVEAQYNSALFEEASVRCWLDMLQCLLKSAMADPLQSVARLNLLSPEAARALRALQPAPVALKGAALAHAGFEQQAQRRPQRAAIRDGQRRCSYGELDAQANRLAHALRERGVGRGQRVGLCLNRGIEMVVAVLAVLKAGAAYVPLDPALPTLRLDQCASDAALHLLITTSDVASAPRAWCADASTRILELDRDTAVQQAPAEPLPPGPQDAGAHDACYVIYTSGSTGRPKGVVVAHAGAANFIESMFHTPGVFEDDRVAAITTLSFDISVVELLVTLAVGAEIVMVQRETAIDGARLLALIQAEQVTLLQATPGTWQLLRDAGWQGTPGLRGWVGGEAVNGRLAQALIDGCDEMWNVYGPTETTVWATAWRMQPEVMAERGMAIGTPIDNTSVWILDEALQPCPVGVPGEICIGGAGVSVGYLHRPELTAERFVTVRMLDVPVPLYRSGDRGRWRHDGLLEHRGRLDFQLKVRGYRVEPGEIEARCHEVQGVGQSVVVAREDRPGDVRLVAYLEPLPAGDGPACDPQALMQHLRASLPAFMLPQHVVVLPALPRLPNGKIDRNSLPRPEPTQRTDKLRAGAPVNDAVARVLAAMEQVLSLPGLAPDDDFFALGGHSLLAARLAAQLGRDFGVVLPLRSLFEAPTPQALAAVLVALQGEGRALPAALPCRPDRSTAPLTPAQERIRFLEELHPGRSVYNAPAALRLTGALDAGRFEAALAEVVRRQSALRTCVAIDAATGEPVQQIAAQLSVSLPCVDLAHLPPDQREDELAERIQALADQPIDIHRAPMFHAALFRITANEHVFVFVPHHLVWDGWSFDLLQAELDAVYGAAERGQPHALAPVATTLGDYAQWLSEWMDTQEFQTQLAFWRERLSSLPPARALPTDMPRRAGRSGQGGTHWIRIDAATTTRLRRAAREMDVTLSMLTFGIYALAMSRAIGSEHIVIGNPVRGRQQSETEAVMGVFNNMLPVPLSIDTTLALPAFMRQVKQELLTLMNYQQVPFERLAVAGSQPRAALSYQAMFSFQDARERPGHIGSLQLRQVHLLQRGATDDVGVWLMDAGEGLQGALIYNADLFKRETGALLRDRYLDLLTCAADAPHASLAALLAASGASAQNAPPEAVAPAGVPAPAVVAVTELIPEQARLAKIWADAIGIDVSAIRPADNFFDLGGDSLLAQRAVEQAARRLGVRVEPRRYLFESLAQIATAAPDKLSITTQSDSAATDAGPLAGRARGILARTLGEWLRKGSS